MLAPFPTASGPLLRNSGPSTTRRPNPINARPKVSE